MMAMTMASSMTMSVDVAVDAAAAVLDHSLVASLLFAAARRTLTA